MHTSFADLGVPADLVAALAARGITEPFPIQAASIPDALAGRDICGRAPTGSGKTIAFGVPVAARVDHAQPHRPRALVLAPTRELAEQIQREMKPLAAARFRRVLAVYGGVGYGPQRKALRNGVDVLVACPGRLADLVRQGDVTLNDVDIVVIDEADRMADMGFLPEVRRLLDATAPDRQTMLYSATLDGEVAVLTRNYQRDPVRHEVGSTDPDLTVARHFFWKVERSHRTRHTAHAVHAAGATIVFCRTRRGADRLARQLNADGVSAAPIHGGRSQGQRDRALRAFSTGRVRALVATDVAARGIHVEGVACIVHYDPPEDAKTYLHRSGRTARAGATGVVVSLVTHEDVAEAKRLQRDVGLHGPIETPAGTSPIVDGTAAVALPASEGRPNGVARRSSNQNRTGRPAGAKDAPRRNRNRRPRRGSAQSAAAAGNRSRA